MQNIAIAAPVPTRFIVLVSAPKIQDAWNWLVTNISDRPKPNSLEFDDEFIRVVRAIEKKYPLNNAQLE